MARLEGLRCCHFFYEFDYKASAINEDSTVTLKAEAVYEADQNKEDNTAETTLRLKNSDLPKPENVIAQAKGGKSVQLKWAAPSITSETVTENFEDYSPWSIDTFGDWASIDGDKGNNGGFWKAPGTASPTTLAAHCVADGPTRRMLSTASSTGPGYQDAKQPHQQ